MTFGVKGQDGVRFEIHKAVTFLLQGNGSFFVNSAAEDGAILGKMDKAAAFIAHMAVGGNGDAVAHAYRPEEAREENAGGLHIAVIVDDALPAGGTQIGVAVQYAADDFAVVIEQRLRILFEF